MAQDVRVSDGSFNEISGSGQGRRFQVSERFIRSDLPKQHREG